MKTQEAFIGKNPRQLANGQIPVEVYQGLLPSPVCYLAQSGKWIVQDLNDSNFFPPELMLVAVLKPDATVEEVQSALVEAEEDALRGLPAEFTDIRISTRGSWIVEERRGKDWWSLTISVVVFTGRCGVLHQ